MTVDSLKNFGRPLGLNNRLPATKLGTSQNNVPMTYLRRADNVDIDDSGAIRRREGLTRAVLGNAHSVWADGDGAFVVINGELVKLAEDLTRTVIRTSMPAKRLSYSRGADGAVYWSNGRVLRKIVGTRDLPATEPGTSTPALVIGSGGLAAGAYLVAVTVLGDSGESAPTQPVRVELAAGSSLTVSAPTGGRLMQVYMSGPNGGVMTWVGEATSALTVSSYAGDGRLLAENLYPMPAGHIVAHFAGRMAVAEGSVLWFSRPWRYGLTNPVADFIPFTERITVLAEVSGGLFICADKTYFLAQVGGELRAPLPYGGVEGTAGRMPDGTVFWFSPHGLVLGAPDGSVKAVQDDNLTFPAATSGASLWRDQKGTRQILTSTAGPSSATVQSSITLSVGD